MEVKKLMTLLASLINPKNPLEIFAISLASLSSMTLASPILSPMGFIYILVVLKSLLVLFDPVVVSSLHQMISTNSDHWTLVLEL